MKWFLPPVLVVFSSAAMAQTIALPDGFEAAVSGEESLERRPEYKASDNVITGSLEHRFGQRVQGTSLHGDTLLNETRLHVKAEAGENLIGTLAFDILADQVVTNSDVDLGSGTGWFDLREAHIQFSPTDFVDVKAGRQILTWGTGNLLFINDLFPKDYDSFISGRDIEYLKAPSDVIKLAFYSDIANLDVIYSPEFDPDRGIDPDRLSYFDPATSSLSNAVQNVTLPSGGEVALRLHRTFGSFETALYYYDGHWKSPGGFNAISGALIHPRLRVAGGSLRGPVGPGLLNLEVGHYDSADDPDGTDGAINNSELRYLIGYEMEVAPELLAGVQLYRETLKDYGAYLANVGPSEFVRSHNRDVVTLRLSRQFFRQTLAVSLFTLHSISDHDGFALLTADYAISDTWSLHGGLQAFWGATDGSPWGQFTENSGVTIAVRANF